MILCGVTKLQWCESLDTPRQDYDSNDILGSNSSLKKGGLQVELKGVVSSLTAVVN